MRMLKKLVVYTLIAFFWAGGIIRLIDIINGWTAMSVVDHYLALTFFIIGILFNLDITIWIFVNGDKNG